MPDKDTKKEALPIRILQLLARIDWKAILLILTASTGAIGAAWNKAEEWINEARSERVQQGTYELLAGRIDELYERVGACEEALGGGAGAEAAGDEISASALGAGGAAGLDADGLAAIAEHAPEPLEAEKPPRAFSKARLPDFRSIQQAAQQVDADAMLGELEGL